METPTLAQSIELGPFLEIVSQGGGWGVALLVLFSLFKGWLRIGNTVDDRLAAEVRRADDAERREKWWQEIAVRQGNLLPTAVKGFEEATVIALERKS